MQDFALSNHLVVLDAVLCAKGIVGDKLGLGLMIVFATFAC